MLRGQLATGLKWEGVCGVGLPLWDTGSDTPESSLGSGSRLAWTQVGFRALPWPCPPNTPT